MGSIIDGMMNQYAKFLKASLETGWRQPVSSLNYLLSSAAWRQEHNGYSHQGPGFINNLLTKKGHTYNIFLPPEYRGSLHDFLYLLSQPVQAGNENAAHIGRQKPALFALYLPAVRANEQQVAFLHIAQDLLGEERVAFGASDDQA